MSFIARASPFCFLGGAGLLIKDSLKMESSISPKPAATTALAFSHPTTLLKQPAVSARTALPKSSMYALIAKGEFPRPVKLTAKAVAWPSDAVDGWIAARIAAGTSA